MIATLPWTAQYWIGYPETVFTHPQIANMGWVGAHNPVIQNLKDIVANAVIQLLLRHHRTIRRGLRLDDPGFVSHWQLQEAAKVTDTALTQHQQVLREKVEDRAARPEF